jgi:hypothetical protein
LRSFILSLLLFSSVIAQDSTYQKILRMKDSVSLLNITEHIMKLELAGGHYSRVTFTPGKDSAAEYIKNEFEKIPGLIVEMDTFYVVDADTPYNMHPLYNIVATIPGKDTPEKQFIIGAHYDASASRMGSTIWNQEWRTIQAPGADDNATGVASIIEMARLLCDTSISFYNKYTIKLIAYAAEEYSPAYDGHHLGSIRHAKNAHQNNEQIVGMISVDMVGFNSQHFYTAIVSDPNSALLGQKMIEARNLFEVQLLTNNPPFPNATYSDHQSYIDEGYRAILLIENAPPWNNGTYYLANPFYHMTSDTSGTVNFELTRRVAQLALVTASSFAALLSDSPEELSAPSEYLLSQNYPNPFNPLTTIGFYIPQRGSVQLSVYDIIGNEVALLINGELSEGFHNVEFNASGLASGIYIYRLSAQGFNVSRKMVFLK